MIFGSPWPDALQVIPDGEPDPVCSRCGVDCPDGGYDHPEGYLCVPCNGVMNPGPMRLSLLERIDLALDNVYFGYAKRFGQRVYR